MHQCKGGKEYFGFPKDCENCEVRFKCKTVCTKPFGVYQYKQVLVFAGEKEGAEQSAKEGVSLEIPIQKEVGNAMPYIIEKTPTGIRIERDIDEDENI